MDDFGLLRTVTFGYVSVLVLALAGALTAIAVYLWRIGSALERVNEALADAARQSGPLREHLARKDPRTPEVVSRFDAAAVEMERAAGQLNEADAMTRQAARL